MTEAIEKSRDRTLSDSEIDPHFEPIISLPEVKVVVDENEELLWKVRAKLYRFDSLSVDGPEWKERGTGEVKFLQNKESNTVRIVMRRDKTFKVCANHFITPSMELKPSTGNDKAFVYTVFGDFADETIKSECLAIKFGSVEHAALFKDKFYECRDLVQRKCELYIDRDTSLKKSQENDVTEKLRELNVSTNDSDEEK
ncbi:hypothetical protein RN001_010816 [Aquatica leii]|uniref:Ran-specific GTPase-activating protein n=1 Tax=Aquatica leii TaxID=1421715 RepID=A0AAN7SQH9_9COLE|nr:hypothetical protein RN001_010816 [Aquatica leii]